MNRYDLASTELDEFQNHDDFIIVWVSLDDHLDRLENFSRYLKRFHSQEHCKRFIREVKSERKILLILTEFDSLSVFHDFIQIQSIYLLLKKKRSFSTIHSENYPKLVDQFIDIDELIARLRKDILLTYRTDLPIRISSINETTTEQSLISLQRNSIMLFWNQLLVHYLINCSKNDINHLKQIMVEQCRIEYANDRRELYKINDFEKNCSDKNILQWYTKDSFVYRLLNKAFRTQNIQLICKFQYFLIVLYKKFRDLANQQTNDPLIVYRGQVLNEKTIKNLQQNVGHFVSTTTLLSTSRDESVARSFIVECPHTIIYHIHIPKNEYRIFKPFIDVSKSSIFSSENEILFYVGTVFSIDSVRRENNGHTIIELTFQNQICEQIQKLIQHFQEYLNHFHHRHNLFMKTDDDRMIDNYYFILSNHTFLSYKNPIVVLYIHLAFFFSNFGLYEKAIELYNETLSINEISMDDPISKVLHIITGYLYFHLSDYENAFLHYGIGLSLLDETNLLICELYNHIGDIWFNMKLNDIAMSCYEQALTIANHRDIPALTNIYQNLIILYTTEENQEKTADYRRQAEAVDDSAYHLEVSTLGKPDLLEQMKNQLDQCKYPSSLQRIDYMYQSGIRFMKDGLFDQSLESFLQARDLILREPPPWRRIPQLLSTLYDNIAWLYLFRHDYLQTLIMWRKSINIRYNFYSSYSIII